MFEMQVFNRSVKTIALGGGAELLSQGFDLLGYNIFFFFAGLNPRQFSFIILVDESPGGRIIGEPQGAEFVFYFFALVEFFYLAGKEIELRFHFFEAYVGGSQVLPNLVELGQGLIFFDLILFDAGGLVKKLLAFFGCSNQKIINCALADDGIGAMAKVGLGQEQVDVGELAFAAIDQIVALAVAIKSPGDG